MQIVECLGILTLHEEMGEGDHKEDIMIIEEEDRLYATNITILDTLQGIIEHLIVRMEPIRGGMYLYVSYEITLDTQQDFA